MQTARFLEDRFCLTEQDGIAGSAKDKIGQAPVGNHVHDLGVAKWLSPRIRIWVWGQR